MYADKININEFLIILFMRVVTRPFWISNFLYYSNLLIVHLVCSRPTN